MQSVQDVEDLKPEIWYVDRQLSFCPKHFVKVDIPYTDEMLDYVLHTLTGRFAILETFVNVEQDYLLTGLYKFICFEDTSEALLYQLKFG